MTDLQEALVRKIVGELKDYDNLYYEICNEPYFGGVTKEWNDRMAAVIADAEKGLAARHLIAQNISNGSAKVGDPNPHVGVLNFHYCSPPDAVAMNYGLNRAVGFDETGFRGTADLPYRTDAWDFLIAGGAVYSNLDYSYSAAHPDGTADVTTSPGGGGIGAAAAAHGVEGVHGRVGFRSYEAGQRRRARRPDHAAAGGDAGGGQGDAVRHGAGAGRKRQGVRRLR